MELQSIPILITFLFILFVGIYVYLYNPRKKVNQLFLILSLLNSFYSFIDFNLINTVDPKVANVLLKLAAIWVIIDAFQMHFILVFTKRIKKGKNTWLHIIYIFTVLMLIHFNIVYSEIEPIKINSAWIPQNINKTPIFKTILTFYQLILTGISIYACISYITNNRDRKIRVQTLLMLLGVILPALFGTLMIDILPRFNISIVVPISYTVGLGWLFIALALRKYNLFNITTEYASRKIISSIIDAFLLIDYNRKIIEANEAFYLTFELEPKDIEEQPIDSFLLQIKAPEISLVKEFTKKELSISNIGFINKSGKQMYIDLSTFFITNKKKKVTGYIFLIRNTTNLVKARLEIEKQHEQMIRMAHQAGMAEFATNVMHNIGNVLNSVSVSSEHLISLLQGSKIKNFFRSNALLNNNLSNITEFLTKDPKGKILPEYYVELGNILELEYNNLQAEGKALTDKIRIMKEVINIQQEYAKSDEFYEYEDINTIIDGVLQILDVSIKKNNIEINRPQSDKNNTKFKIQKSKLLNVLLNILKNSIEALKESNKPHRKITIRLEKTDLAMMDIEISDNGIGIEQGDLSKIFSFGYTKKPNGHGFGLHYCANAVKEMKGSITVESDGPDQGAKFVVSIPVNIT